MFKFVLTDSMIREKMLSFLRPILCSASNRVGYSINWVYGVYNDEKDIFITLIYYVPDGLAHCNMDYYQYIVIVGEKTVFSVTNNFNYGAGAFEFSIPSDYQEFSEIIKEGIKFYENFAQKRLFEKNLEETGKITDYYSYCEDISTQMDSQIIQ